MKRLTLDASVVCKWFLEQEPDEPNLSEARRLLDAIRAGQISLVQPPHWLAEVLAVMVRRRPAFADAVALALIALDVPCAGDAAVHRRAAQLAKDTGSHVFDTLYHAVALETPGCQLVTADVRYHAAAQHVGAVVRLDEYRVDEGVSEPLLDYAVAARRAIGAAGLQPR